MDSLPSEITLAVAKNLSPEACRSLARTASQYHWILNEESLWSHFADQEVDCPPDTFKLLLKEGRGPVETYLSLTRCRAPGPSHPGSHFLSKNCRENTVPGSPYCPIHTKEKGIKFCSSCEVRASKPNSPFCLQCLRNGKSKCCHPITIKINGPMGPRSPRGPRGPIDL